MATMTKIRVQSSSMDVYLDGPARDVPGPAIVLAYHRGGIDNFTKLVVNRLVSFGYLVAVPEIAHRCPPDMPMRDRKALLKDSEVVDDFQATVDYLRSRPDVAADQLIVMGHCMGGRVALLAAGSLAEFRGVVVYYGGSVEKSWGNDQGPTPMERLRNIRCPVIGFFGDQDVHPSAQVVDQIDSELTRHGIEHDFYRYPDVGHGFQNPAHDTPEERRVAEDSWAKTFTFLRKIAPVFV
jgi:carboxymethylenebutenolidase